MGDGCGVGAAFVRGVFFSGHRHRLLERAGERKRGEGDGEGGRRRGTEKGDGEGGG